MKYNNEGLKKVMFFQVCLIGLAVIINIIFR